MEIEIITDVTGTKGFIPTKKSKLNLEKLKANLKSFCEDITNIIPTEHFNSMELSEVILTVEISAEGGISLIGTSKIAASSAVQIKFSKIGK